MNIKFLWGNFLARSHLGDLGIDEKVTALEKVTQ
jgi:hypothetical protein